MVWLGLGVAVLAAPDPKAKAAPPTLKVIADRAEAIYRQGETVTFQISLLPADALPEDAEVQWTITKDGVPPQQSGKLKLPGGRGSITGKLDEPGFLLCKVTCQTPAKAALTALGGAAVDPLLIKPSLPVPDDFDAFWAQQRQKLAAVPMNARLAPVKSPAAEIACFDLQADCVGAPVSGYFAKPAGAKPKSLPAILTVHGAGVRSSSLGAAATWAREQMLALDINAHGLPNGQPEKFYTDLANGELKDYRTRGRESRDTIYFQGMFIRLMRAMDFLCSQPEWDGRTLVVHGSSQGGAQSIVAAGLDARVTFIAAGVPAMCDHTGIVAGRVNGWPKFIASGSDNAKPDPKVVEAVRYYDAMNFGTRAKAEAILTVGFIDTTCPPTSVYAAYNAYAGKKTIFNDPPSTHTVSPKAGEAMRNAIRAHVLARRENTAP